MFVCVKREKLDTCKCDSNHKMEACKSLTVLGVDFSAGRPVTFDKNKERIKVSSDKAAKILNLGKGGTFLLNVMKTHVQSAAMYGVRVNGITDKDLAKVKAMVRAATSTRAAGGSATIDLLLQRPKDADPIFAACTLPLLN